MPYWRMYCHIVWTTKGQQPLIGPIEIEIIDRSLRSTYAETGVILHATGHMPDHLHVALSIPPKHAVADLVRRMKGASSHAVNVDTRRIERPRFVWQDEYGAFSFSEKALPRVVADIENQEAIHANRQTWSTLERIDDDRQPVSTGLSQ